MLKASRHIWTGAAAVCMVLAAPAVTQAQEFLPPVIDRSSGAVQSGPSQSSPARQQGVSPKAAQSLEDRVKKLERLLDNEALVDMLMRLDNLQSESQNLRGEIETLGHELEGIKQRQRDLYLDIDRRLREIEVSLNQLKRSALPAAAPAGAAMATPSVAAPGRATPGLGTTTGPAAAAPADPAAEREAYQQAFNLLKEGQYDKAITAFETFLTRYPQGDYTDNAQYWLGEANYVTRRFQVAEQEFLKVLNQHPGSSKASDAMLKLGYTYYELGNWDAARKTLENVKERFPGTTVGRLAENRLQKMRLEGR